MLHSITLSNIRRFAENVTIDVGAGVTLILAPNGSGKTAIFEAVELALTGGVQRIGPRLENIVRDGGEYASVKLNFGDWTREALIQGGESKIVKPGKIGEIFGDVDPKDIPYLLRLTHLLDQRDRSWFCQQESSADAGKQLSLLPVGRDAAQVSSSISKAKTALSRAMNEAEERILVAESDIDNWKKAVAQRDRAISELGRELIPLSELGVRLKSLSENGVDSTLGTVDAIRNQWNCAKTSKEQKRRELQASVAAILSLESHPKRHAELTRELAENEIRLELSEKARFEKEESLKSILRTLEEKSQQGGALSQKITAHQKEADLRGSYQADLLTAEQAVKASSIAKENELSFLSKLLEAKEIYQKAESDHVVYEAAQQAKQALLDREKAAQLAKTGLLRWREFNNKKENIGALLTEQVEILRAQSQAIQVAASKRELQEKEVLKYRDFFNSLSSAHDSLKSAVALIGENIPPDSEKCPVCLTWHGSNELRARISRSINEIDPKINEASEQLREANAKLLLVASDERSLIVEWTRSEKRRHELLLELESLSDAIANAQSHPLLANMDLETAESKLVSVIEEVAEALKQLRKNTVSPPNLSVVERFALKQNVDIADAEFGKAVDERIRADERTVQITNMIGAGKYELVKNTELPEYLARIDNARNELNVIKDIMNELEQNCAALRAEISKCDDEVSRFKNEKEQLKSRIIALEGEWSALNLTGHPSSTLLLERREFLEVAERVLSREIDLLNEIETDIVRLENSKIYNEAELHVQRLRKERNEKQFLDWLTNSLESARSLHAKIVQRREALETLSMNLTSGIADVREQVGSIVPQWQAILRRIIQEPRFSEANLNYFSKWNKSHASVEVALGKKNVAVADVASQAQMTDLQLSFLLSMALKNQWSSWRALLLDDPTQHHDLIHASSVFDVIRDFVCEHNFQVLMTTHDALQARFMMRKLSNDGIAARLWTLEPTISGMVGRKISEHVG